MIFENVLYFQVRYITLSLRFGVTIIYQQVLNMSQAIIPLKGTGMPTLTTKTVLLSKTNSSTGQTEEVKQNYIDRIRGYIPVEVVAFYVFVNSLISDKVSTGAGGFSLTADGYVAIIATIFGLIGTVLYIKLSSKNEDISAWKFSACIAIVAFLIWIYAMDARIFEVLNLSVVPSVSGLLLATFTLFVGVVVPTSKEQSDNAGTLM